MARLIDADAILEVKWWDSLTNHFDKAKAKIIIQSAKTVDAVEVVRCKDCKHKPTCKHTRALGINGYCSEGERREAT